MFPIYPQMAQKTNILYYIWREVIKQMGQMQTTNGLGKRIYRSSCNFTESVKLYKSKRAKKQNKTKNEENKRPPVASHLTQK